MSSFKSVESAIQPPQVPQDNMKKKRNISSVLFKPLLFTWKSKWAEKYIYWTEYVTFQFLLQASCDDKILMWQPSLL